MNMQMRDPRDMPETEYLRRRLHHLESTQQTERQPLRGHDGMKKLTDFPEWSAEDDLYEDAFWYTFNALGNIAPGLSAQQNIQIQGDSKFEWMKTTLFAVLHGAALPNSSNTVPLLSVFFSDTGSGRNLMNAPVPASSIAGDGKLSYIMGVTQIFQPNATVQCVVTSNDAVSTWDSVQVTLHGRKIFKGAQAG